MTTDMLGVFAVSALFAVPDLLLSTLLIVVGVVVARRLGGPSGPLIALGGLLYVVYRAVAFGLKVALTISIANGTVDYDNLEAMFGLQNLFLSVFEAVAMLLVLIGALIAAFRAPART